MGWTGKMVDMEMDDEAKLDAPMPIAMLEKPQYPYGLRICLNSPELEKLGLDADCDLGDTIDMRAFAEVTCVSKEGDNCRVELQIQKLAVESEDKLFPW